LTLKAALRERRGLATFGGRTKSGRAFLRPTRGTKVPPGRTGPHSPFVEGQNLKVDGGGYGLRDEQLPVHPPALTEGVICRRALE
jgi:hypothetical protein